MAATKRGWMTRVTSQTPGAYRVAAYRTVSQAQKVARVRTKKAYTWCSVQFYESPNFGTA